MGSPISIMGVPFDNVTTAHTLALIQRMIESRAPHYIATANVDFLVQAQSDDELHRILLDAHLVLCDGTPLVWASRWLGNPLPERVAGSDIVPLMLRLAAERGYRVFLLGAAEELNRKAAENIAKDHPGLIVAGRYSPPLAPLEKMDHEDIRQRIRDARPDIVLVAFGCPKQEKWISMNYRTLAVPVCVGVGATIDFLAGAVSRAPMWMRKCGLEWTWRLINEPRRLARRYLKGFFVFGRGLLRQRWRTGGRVTERVRNVEIAPIAEVPSVPAIPALPAGEMQLMLMPERLDAVAVQRSRANWESQPCSDNLIVDLKNTRFVDSTGVGYLIRLRRMAREKGAKFALANVPEKVWRTIEMMKLGSAFPVGKTVEEAIVKAA
jgi:N-acetylglucosaminyldiphosphoundecaprenol N-acetyl-beta-D-mannosaminyltransferase